MRAKGRSVVLRIVHTRNAHPGAGKPLDRFDELPFAAPALSSSCLPRIPGGELNALSLNALYGSHA
jgi:hypothetical protein